MFDRRKIQQDFSLAAPRYDAHADLQQQVLSALIAKATPLLPPQAQVLDAGCGTGRLARQLQGHSIMQMDIAHAMCRQAAGPGAPAVCGAVEALPFQEGAFDAVFSSLVLQWVPDAQAALAEMRRVLKPGGVLAVSTFGTGTLKELRESFTAVDSHAHVSAFHPPAEFAAAQTVTEYYPNLFALMRHLKSIGAGNKMLARRKSLMTRAEMQRVERHYEERFKTKSGLPVTWEILYLVTRKI